MATPVETQRSRAARARVEKVCPGDEQRLPLDVAGRLVGGAPPIVE